MTILFRKPRGQRKAVLQSPLCNKPSPKLLVKNNKHFIICNNFISWLVSVGCSVPIWYHPDYSSMGWNIQDGAFTWLAAGAGHLQGAQQLTEAPQFSPCELLKSSPLLPASCDVGFCGFERGLHLGGDQEAVSGGRLGTHVFGFLRSLLGYYDIRASWIVWACGFCILNYSTPAKERLCISYQILSRNEEWWFVGVTSPGKANLPYFIFCCLLHSFAIYCAVT